jgi:hypothetical protein
MMPKHSCWLGLLCALVAAGVGCGGAGKPVPVRGTVLLDGQPLSGATVTFMPMENVGRSASGMTVEDGSFRLTTFNQNDGALPGEYKVTVTLEEAGEVLKPSGAEYPMQGSVKEKREFFAKVGKGGRERKKTASSPVPPVYKDPNRTPLRQLVPPDGPVQLELITQRPTR